MTITTQLIEALAELEESPSEGSIQAFASLVSSVPRDSFDVEEVLDRLGFTRLLAAVKTFRVTPSAYHAWLTIVASQRKTPALGKVCTALIQSI